MGFDLKPPLHLSGIFVCWVELRCVDKAFSTRMLSGWPTDKCVSVNVTEASTLFPHSHTLPSIGSVLLLSHQSNKVGKMSASWTPANTSCETIHLSVKPKQKAKIIFWACVLKALFYEIRSF